MEEKAEVSELMVVFMSSIGVVDGDLNAELVILLAKIKKQKHGS